MRLQHFYLQLYRSVGFVFLAGLVCAILWYALSVLFFSTNSNWSIPMVLSPTQDKVIGHLSQVSSFEQTLNQQKIELSTSTQELESKQQLLEDSVRLYDRLTKSVSAQAKRYEGVSQGLSASLKEKQQTMAANQANMNAAKESLKSIDTDLKMGLITKQQAANQKLALYALSSTIIDDKTQLQQIRAQTGEMASAANTLGGGESNLNAIVSVTQGADLALKIAQLKTDIFKLTETIDMLTKTIENSEKILNGLKDSPYLLAIKVPTTVVFVPYDNMTDVKEGVPIYTCFLKMIFCSRAGRITKIYEAEEYSRHPMFRTDLKGRLVGVHFDNEEDAQKDLAFIDHRPMFF